MDAAMTYRQDPPRSVFEPTAVDLNCEACRHKWQERIELPMTVEAALARIRGWCTCPNCGSDDHVYIGEMKEAHLRKHGTSKMWNSNEDDLLLKHYPDIPKLVNLLGRTHKAIWSRAYRHHHLRQNRRRLHDG